MRVLLPYAKALGIQTMLSVGCAGLTTDLWVGAGIRWHGLTFPAEAARLKKKGLPVDVGAAESLPYPSGSFDLVYASHVYEHSVMPLICLIEAKRVARRACVMAAPAWPHLIESDGHMSVVPPALWLHWFEVAGWTVGADLSNERFSRWILVKALPDGKECKRVHYNALRRKRRREQREKKRDAATA